MWYNNFARFLIIKVLLAYAMTFSIFLHHFQFEFEKELRQFHKDKHLYLIKIFLLSVDNSKWGQILIFVLKDQKLSDIPHSKQISHFS